MTDLKTSLSDNEMNLKDAVPFLLARFPELPASKDEEFSAEEPFYAYGVFAAEIERRSNDPTFFAAACRFIDDLEKTGSPQIRDVLITAVLEKVAEDTELVSKVKNCIQEPALTLLRTIERDLYGRDV